MGKQIILIKVVRFIVIIIVTAVGFISIIATSDEKPFVETSQIECNIKDISITSKLVGTNSSAGDTITGKIEIKCKSEDGSEGVSGVMIRGSGSYWYVIGDVGPSNSDGIISVNKPAKLSDSDVGTKSVDITLKGYDNDGKKATKVVTIYIQIN
ncbi:hypothetical protein KA005_49665 [bacterium]|nr:hypothetical protein [bacterium]